MLSKLSELTISLIEKKGYHHCQGFLHEKLSNTERANVLKIINKYDEWMDPLKEIPTYEKCRIKENLKFCDGTFTNDLRCIECKKWLDYLRKKVSYS